MTILVDVIAVEIKPPHAERVPIFEAAGFLGMSAEMLTRTYGHHHPDYQKQAAGG